MAHAYHRGPDPTSKADFDPRPGLAEPNDVAGAEVDDGGNALVIDVGAV